MSKKTINGNIKCWCGEEGGSHIKNDSWIPIPSTSYTLVKCSNCETIRTLSCVYEGYTENLYKKLSLRHFNSIKTIQEFCSGDMLDIGSNCGEILNQLRNKENISSVMGIDFNEDAIKYGKEKFNIDIKNYTLELLLEKEEMKYDSIIMTHTFEHIASPLQFLKDVKKLFKSNGSKLLYICVPNIENQNINSFGALDPREHHWHFTEMTLTQLLIAGLGDVKFLEKKKSHIWNNNEQLEFVVSLAEGV